MNSNIRTFRDACAEDGIELTPQEAGKFFNAYEGLREQIEEAIRLCPTFYMDLINRTTEDKLEDLKRMNARSHDKMTLREYNDLQRTIKKICELEGYA